MPIRHTHYSPYPDGFTPKWVELSLAWGAHTSCRFLLRSERRPVANTLPSWAHRCRRQHVSEWETEEGKDRKQGLVEGWLAEGAGRSCGGVNRWVAGLRIGAEERQTGGQALQEVFTLLWSCFHSFSLLLVALRNGMKFCQLVLWKIYDLRKK